MCKLLIIPGLNPDKSELNWEFIKTMANKMSKSNNDGLGYVSLTPDNKVCVERWHNNNEAFVLKENNTSLSNKYLGFLETNDVSNKYSKVGTQATKISAIMLHVRYATSGKEFKNTHPFYDVDTQTTLVHNGVIKNVETKDNIRSTCDSERILNKYLEHGIASKINNVQNMIDDLKGYFACGVLTKVNSNMVIDIFKSRANLFAAFIKEMECMVFSTNLTDIESTCNELNLTITDSFKCVDNVLIRFNAHTGKPLTKVLYKDTADYVQEYKERTYPVYKTYEEYNWYNRKVQDISNLNTFIDESKNVVNVTKLKLNEAEANGWKYDQDSLTWELDNVYIK